MTKILFTVLILNVITISMGQLIQLRPSEFRRLSHEGHGYYPFAAKPIEPNCEELKAMWRFSTRQARASEITNNLPKFKDPFAYNIWKKHPDMRHLANPRRTTGRMRSPPVYGRVVYAAPSDHPRVLNPDPPKYYGVVRYFEPTEEEQARRNFGLAATFGPPNRRQKGSFERLKELVYADRMREMNQQRTHLLSPVAGNNSPKLGLARASAPLPASAPVPSPAPVPTPYPPASPPPAGVPLPVKETPPHIFRPYEAAFRGQQPSDYVPPYRQNRNTRLSIISEYFDHNHENIDEDGEQDTEDNEGNEDKEEEIPNEEQGYEMPNEEQGYEMPYRFKMFVDEEPFFDM